MILTTAAFEAFQPEAAETFSLPQISQDTALARPKSYQEYLRHATKLSNVLVDQAQKLAARGDFSRARDRYRKAININRENRSALMGYAEEFMRIGQYGLAERSAEAVSRLGVTTAADVLFFRAICRLSSGFQTDDLFNGIRDSRQEITASDLEYYEQLGVPPEVIRKAAEQIEKLHFTFEPVQT